LRADGRIFVIFADRARTSNKRLLNLQQIELHELKIEV